MIHPKRGAILFEEINNGTGTIKELLFKVHKIFVNEMD